MSKGNLPNVLKVCACCFVSKRRNGHYELNTDCDHDDKYDGDADCDGNDA